MEDGGIFTIVPLNSMPPDSKPMAEKVESLFDQMSFQHAVPSYLADILDHLRLKGWK
jgi:hypothetical protein